MNRRKKWKHAIYYCIRRDEGEYFQIKETTKVCSRHFRENDFKKILAGRRELRTDAIPSVFAWTRTSPRKRKPPTLRESIAGTSRIIFEETETEEELNDSENFVNEGESTQCENMTTDAETQTEPSEDIETALKQQIESNLSKINCSLLKNFKTIITPYIFTQDYQTGIFLCRFLDF